MSENKILTFYQAVAASTTLQKKLTAALDLPEENQKMEAVLDLAKEAGCPFTASEWQQAVSALGEYSDTKPASKDQQPQVEIITLTDPEMEERRMVFGGRLMVHQNEVCSHYQRGGNLFTYAACCASCKYEDQKECTFDKEAPAAAAPGQNLPS